MGKREKIEGVGRHMSGWGDYEKKKNKEGKNILSGSSASKTDRTAIKTTG